MVDKNFWVDSIKDGFVGTVQFIVGFLIGTMIDAIFFQLYKRLDPTQDRMGILLIIIFLQIFTLSLIFSGISRYIPMESLDNFFIRFGILSSQIFLIKFAGQKLGFIVYDRKKGKSNVARSLSTLPIIGGFFKRQW